ncbi:MAG: VWA domain-containing protein, partial [Chitinophagaceae bacterium]
MMHVKPFARAAAVLLLVLLLLQCGNAFAQTSMDVEVTVVDDRQQPLPDARVQLLELATHRQLEQSSDGRGIAQFRLDKAGEYQVSVNDQVQSSDPVLVRGNQHGSTSLYLTYNPSLQERTRRQTFDRSGLADVAVQGQVAPEDVAEGYNRLEIEVVNSARQRLAGKRVCLVSLANRKRYVAYSDASGMAYFHLPGKTAYDIDVEEQLNASFIIQDQLEGYTLSQTVVYDQYDMTETRRNDTVLQQIRLPLDDKHSRAVYRIKVRRDGKTWNNGLIFLDEIGTRTVYKGRTDGKGEAVFILPFGKKYLVHFPYERDVDVVNLVDARNIAAGSLDITYVPNPALEHPERFVPTPAQLMLTDFPYYHRAPYPLDPAAPSPLVLRAGGIGPEAVLEIGVSARAVEGSARPPLNMAFVLDISGSMSGYERIESLKRGLIALLGKLRERDVLSITLFNDNQRLLLPAQALGHDREKIIALVQGIEPSGGTDMKAALETAYTQAMRFYRADGANTLVLLSDGYDSNPVETLLAVQA